MISDKKIQYLTIALLVISVLLLGYTWYIRRQPKVSSIGGSSGSVNAGALGPVKKEYYMTAMSDAAISAIRA